MFQREVELEFGQIHHLEFYVSDLQRSNDFWSWFLPSLGYKKFQEFDQGISWVHKSGTYIVFVQVNDKYINAEVTRQAKGLNHLAFVGRSQTHLNELHASILLRKLKIIYQRDGYLCFEDPNEFAVEVYAAAP